MSKYLQDEYLDSILEDYFEEANKELSNDYKSTIEQVLKKIDYIFNLKFKPLQSRKIYIATFELDIDKYVKYKLKEDLEDLLESGKYKSVWEVIKMINPKINKDISDLEKELNSKLKEKIKIKYVSGDNDAQQYSIKLQ